MRARETYVATVFGFACFRVAQRFPNSSQVFEDGFEIVGFLGVQNRGERLDGTGAKPGRSSRGTSRDPQPISHTLGLREAAYETLGLHPFFENLLPQGWLLELATKKLKLSATDRLGLLLATCADCVGAVEIRPAAVPEADVD